MPARASAIATQKDESLNDQQLADLRKSGLTDATIKAAGIYSASDAAIAAILGWQPKAMHWGRGTVYPYPQPPAGWPPRPAGGPKLLKDPRTLSYCRVKLLHPRYIHDKAAKYESPKQRQSRIYFPPGCEAAVKDASKTLIVTEGEKKALALCQAGFPAIGLVGVWGWMVAREKDSGGRNLTHRRELLPDLAMIPWAGRPVVIMFDSDAAQNRRVQQAAAALAKALEGQTAVVRLAKLAPAPGGEKVGADDFLVAHGDDPGAALRTVLDSAQVASAAFAKTEPKPVPVADEWLLEQGMDSDGFGRLAWWRGAYYWYEPRTNAWRPEGQDELHARLLRWRSAVDPNVRPHFIDEVIRCLRSRCVLAATATSPHWLQRLRLGDDDVAPAPPPPRPPAAEMMAARNCLVHLPTLFADKTKGIMPPTPALFTTSTVTYSLDLNAPRPDVWFSFLASLFGDDLETVHLIQEWFGYCLTPDTKQQKILMMIGPTRCGKGTIARVLTAVIGAENVANPTMSMLAERFGPWALMNASVAIISDARVSQKMDSSVAVERLLTISGEDPLTIDRKGLPSVTARLPCRLMILTNELPRLGDASGAMASRLLIIRMTKSFLGREDHTLEAKLQPELPSILLWAMEGLRRLRARGRFVQPNTGASLSEDMEEFTSPITAFANECLDFDPEARTDTEDLYGKWRQWNSDRGHQRVGDAAVFCRDLVSRYPDLTRGQRRAGDGSRPRYYKGVRIRSENETAGGEWSSETV